VCTASGLIQRGRAQCVTREGIGLILVLACVCLQAAAGIKDDRERQARPPSGHRGRISRLAIGLGSEILRSASVNIGRRAVSSGRTLRRPDDQAVLPVQRPFHSGPFPAACVDGFDLGVGCELDAVSNRNSFIGFQPIERPNFDNVLVAVLGEKEIGFLRARSTRRATCQTVGLLRWAQPLVWRMDCSPWMLETLRAPAPRQATRAYRHDPVARRRVESLNERLLLLHQRLRTGHSCQSGRRQVQRTPEPLVASDDPVATTGSELLTPH
jgi:hypothetical protein